MCYTNKLSYSACELSRSDSPSYFTLNCNITNMTKLTLDQIFSFFCIYNHRTTKTNQKYPSVNL